ncbi:MAG: hypothetical protein ACR2GU_12255 [Rubrobacteraceae bacterium]
MNVFFDIQGTLVSGGVPRPHARETFAEILGSGHEIYLWSSAGSSYASAAAKMLGVEDLISGCYSKSGPLPVNVDFAVDDQPFLVDLHGGYAITPFNGDPADTALHKVTQVLRG